MPYKVLKPEISDPHKAAWDRVRARQNILIPTVLVGVLAVGLFTSWVTAVCILLFAILLLVLYVGKVMLPKATDSFWKQLAEVNNWQLIGDIDPKKESGLLFNHGGSISNCIEGVVNERNFRFFNYQFSEGSGKDRVTYVFAVFAFKFHGSFPQIYLQNVISPFRLMGVEKIPLPVEFGARFSLIVPKEYEVEALEIVTQAVMAYLLDNDFTCDIEFVNQEMLVTFNATVIDFESFEIRFNKALDLGEFLKDKLDRVTFQPVGNMSVTL